jgi:hypothetical protein
MHVPKFTIVYNDGREVNGGGEDDELVPVYFSKKWLEAPSDGVSHIVVEVPDIGRHTTYGHEYYYQLPLNYHGAGDIGGSMKIGPYLRQLVGTEMSVVKFGGWTSTESYQARARQAHLSTHVPQTCGKRREQQEDPAD